MSNIAIDLLKLLQGKTSDSGLHIVTVKGSALVIEGSPQALDEDIFVIPLKLKPLVDGGKYFALPIADASVSTRWGIIQKIN